VHQTSATNGHTVALCFGFPNPLLDWNVHNAYVGDRADFRRFFPLRLLDFHRDNARALVDEVAARNPPTQISR
jgi:hypothetical protein